MTFGKGMANGFSVAAVAGGREVMEVAQSISQVMNGLFCSPLRMVVRCRALELLWKL